MEKGTLVTASKTGGPGSDPVPTGQWPKDDGVKDQARGTGWEQGGGGGDLGGEGRKTAHSPSSVAGGGVTLSLAGQGQTLRSCLPQWPRTGTCGGLYWTVGLGTATCPWLHSPVADQASCLLLSPLCLCPAAALSLTLAPGRETEAP